MGESIGIRAARADEFIALADIEIDAFSALKQSGGADGEASAMPQEKLEAALSAGLLFVATDPNDRPIGFVAAWPFDDGIYLGEIDVAVDWQRKGIGRQLLAAVLDAAQQGGFATAVLTTDRFVPFNAPFYASLGFEEIAEEVLSSKLRAILSKEIEDGMQADRRVAMRRAL